MSLRKIALVTGVGGAAGVFLINHLKQNNFKVIAVDSNPYATGLLYGDANYVVPNCLEARYPVAIREICHNESVDIAIPLIDEELLIIKKMETEAFHVLCPQVEFISKCIDKHCLMDELRTIDIPIPHTFLLSDFKDQLGFPLIVKPKTGRGSRNVFTINNYQDLKEVTKKLRKEYNNYIIQEKIFGDEFTVSVVTNQNNSEPIVVPKKIILKKGITHIAVTEISHDIHNICHKIVKAMSPCNPFNVQLIIDRKKNIPYIFEINPRYSTTVTLTINAGVDEIMLPINSILDKNWRLTPLKPKNGIVLLRSTLETFLDIDEYKDKNRNIVHI